MSLLSARARPPGRWAGERAGTGSPSGDEGAGAAQLCSAHEERAKRGLERALRARLGVARGGAGGAPVGPANRPQTGTRGDRTRRIGDARGAVVCKRRRVGEAMQRQHGLADTGGHRHGAAAAGLAARVPAPGRCRGRPARRDRRRSGARDAARRRARGRAGRSRDALTHHGGNRVQCPVDLGLGVRDRRSKPHEAPRVRAGSRHPHRLPHAGLRAPLLATPAALRARSALEPSRPWRRKRCRYTRRDRR